VLTFPLGLGFLRSPSSFHSCFAGVDDSLTRFMRDSLAVAVKAREVLSPCFLRDVSTKAWHCVSTLSARPIAACVGTRRSSTQQKVSDFACPWEAAPGPDGIHRM